MYKIRWGDTLSAIAARHGTSVSTLARLNGISNPDKIYAGRSLRLPGQRDSFERPAPAAARRPSAGSAPPRTNGPDRMERAPEGGSALGRRLASAGRAAALSIGGYTSRGLCATGVSRAIQNSMGFKVWGNGNQIDNNLPRSRFRQVNLSLAEALRIPGAVMTWERTSTRLGRIYGHTAISAGDGRTSYSDFIERNTLTAGGRSGFKVFLPIG